MSVDKGHSVKITASGYAGTKVEIDGVEIQQLVSVDFEHRIDSVAHLVLTIYPREVILEGVVEDVKILRGETE